MKRTCGVILRAVVEYLSFEAELRQLNSGINLYWRLLPREIHGVHRVSDYNTPSLRLFTADKWQCVKRIARVDNGSRLFTKVYTIFGQCRRFFLVFKIFPRFSTSCFILEIFAIKLHGREKRPK